MSIRETRTLKSKRQGFKSEAYCLLAVGPRAGFLAALIFGFLVCEMGVHGGKNRDFYRILVRIR